MEKARCFRERRILRPRPRPATFRVGTFANSARRIAEKSIEGPWTPVARSNLPCSRFDGLRRKPVTRSEQQVGATRGTGTRSRSRRRASRMSRITGGQVRESPRGRRCQSGRASSLRCAPARRPPALAWNQITRIPDGMALDWNETGAIRGWHVFFILIFPSPLIFA